MLANRQLHAEIHADKPINEYPGFIGLLAAYSGKRLLFLMFTLICSAKLPLPVPRLLASMATKMGQ